VPTIGLTTKHLLIGLVAGATLTAGIIGCGSSDSPSDKLAKSVSGADGGTPATCEQPPSVDWWWCKTGEDSFLGVGTGVYEGDSYIVKMDKNGCWRGLPAWRQDTRQAHIVVERREELRGCVGRSPEGDVGKDPDLPPLPSTVIARGEEFFREL
jgi:hypothetical protein